MAAYPKYQPQFGIYNPNNFSRQPTANDGLTIDTAKLYFLQFPNAQTSQTEYLHSIGVSSDATFNGIVTFNEAVTYNNDIEFLANVLVDGTATVTGNLLCDSTATVTDILTCETGIDISTSGGITFPDNTTQTTAFIEANYAQLNTDNTFLPTFTNDFNGNVNLNGITNGVTPLTGDNSTLLATTEFVQNTVQVSGVQVGDSPLIWTGANSWQYNAGTTGTLPYTYPYGISNIWNLTGGGGDCDLVCNSGVGSVSSAFNIYCVSGDITGNGLRLMTPQFTISNDGSPTIIRDGINVYSQNIINIGALAGVGGNISCNSNFLIGAGNVLDMQTNNIINASSITLGSNTVGSNSYISQTGAVLTISNTYPSTSSPNLNLYVKNSGGIDRGIQITTSTIFPSLPINMNTQDITNIGAGSSAVTQLPDTNNTSIATTAFVTQAISSAIPIYTTTTATMTQGGDMTPLTVYTTCITDGGYATFASGAFSVTLNGYFLFLKFQWAEAPWNGYPPAASGQSLNINTYCTTNKTNYSCPVLFNSSFYMQIYIPTGAPTANGTNYTFNLQSFGKIPQ